MAMFTLQKIEHLAVLTLTSASKRNLLTPDSAVDIAAAVSQLASDPDVKALAVTGQAGAFCAGADLAALQQAGQGDAEILQQIYTAFTAVANAPLYTIALVNGPAIGAGFNLAMACDVRLASAEAWFESRFFNLAIHPGGGHTWLLPQLVGWQQAAAMLFSGERLSAQQALACGFVRELVDEEALLTHAKRLTEPLRHVPAALVRQTKQSMLTLRQCRQLDEAVAAEFIEQFQSLQRPAAQQQISTLLARLQQNSR